MKQETDSQEIVVNISPLAMLIGIIGIIIVSFGLFRVISSFSSRNASNDESGDSSVVTVENGRQIVTINVQGNYSPRVVSAKGGIPTTLRMRSNNSYGCERAFSIPKMKIQKTLPANGDTDIDIGAPESGSNLFGTCSMGMYTMRVNFN